MQLDIFNISWSIFQRNEKSMVHWEKQNRCYTYWILKKGVTHIFSHCLCGFSVHQVFKMKIADSELIEKIRNAQLPGHLKNPELFELIETYQLYTHSTTSWKQQEWMSFPVWSIFYWEENYCNNLNSNLNHAKVNVIDQKNTILVSHWVFKKF